MAPAHPPSPGSGSGRGSTGCSGGSCRGGGTPPHDPMYLLPPSTQDTAESSGISLSPLLLLLLLVLLGSVGWLQLLL